MACGAILEGPSTRRRTGATISGRRLTREEQDELEQDRLKNVERYRLRVRLGLPLFVEVASRLVSKKPDGATATGSA